MSRGGGNEKGNELVIRNLAEELKKKKITREDFQRIKKALAKQSGTSMPANREILETLGVGERKKYLSILQKKPGRTASGVSILAVMTKPDECPHGTCVYCPKVSGVPQSYVDDEPAVMRAKALGYDPFEQTLCRLKQLKIIGHPASKIELVVMGGTFTSRPATYKKGFVKGCYDGLNGFISRSLPESIAANEKAEHRCVGLTIETRPDNVGRKDIDLMLSFGTTRVEIGVQNPDDRIYAMMKRGHKVEDVVKATQLLKDSGLKVCYHIMPNLPGSDPEKDLKMFRKIFRNPVFRPDMLKLYPTLVVEGSELEKMYMKGDYVPYETENLVELMMEMKKTVPEYARIMRLQRDVPSQHIVAGCKNTNLRQMVLRRMKERGMVCRCIRCREIMHEEIGPQEMKNHEIKAKEYEGSGGQDFFIQAVTENDRLIGLARLRFPFRPFRKEITPKTALVRELRVFGPSIPVGIPSGGSPQHRGIGRSLLKKAEEIAKEHGKKKILVTSGTGAREYYRKLGYVLEGVYMGKRLR